MEEIKRDKKVYLCYNYFGANENIIGAGFGDEKTRGHNTQLIVGIAMKF